MKDFERKLDELLCETGQPDNRPIVIGRLEVMEQIYPAIRDYFGDNDELSQKASHPEVPDRQIMHGPNPDVMVTVDQASKIWSLGTNNCITCRHFTAGGPCPRWAEKDRHVVLNQPTAIKYGVGGCPLQQLIPDLAEEHKTSGGLILTSPNELFDEISEAIAEENGDDIVIYKNGSYKILPAREAGAGQERRGRNFDEFQAVNDEPEENWESED